MIRNSVSDWQELSALYEEAEALDAESRASWLADLRTRGHRLLGQLERMLQASSDARQNGFLNAPATGIGVSLAPHAEPAGDAGSRVGPYRLLRQIGEGGMAEVWLAERDDGAFQRQVAIKLLHRQSFGLERTALEQRFARERDILASLDHPNIAALHDAGVTVDHQPWLALEYVEGKTLTSWCDDEQLSIEQRVRLFKQVLLAVQHAHAKLVIHRDLKPANILVTADGTVRLLDFGIAKLLQAEGNARPDTDLTREGGRPLTLQYTSPEQLVGAPLTTGSDVYSAGVVLYELLCGERPYELRHESAARLEDAILESEPRPPSRRELDAATSAKRGGTPAELRRLLADDLDAVVLRSLEKSPGNRYPSIEALAMDLERWLQGKPVSASPPSALRQARKFVARHKLGVASSALALILLVGVSSIAVWKAISASEEERRVAAARDFFLHVFTLANADDGRVAEMSARELLDAGRKKAMTELTPQPRLQAEVLSGIATVQTLTGDYAPADAALQEVVRIYTRLGDRRGALAAEVDAADAQFRMGALAAAKASLQEAEAQMASVPAPPSVQYKAESTRGWIDLQEGDIASARTSLKAALEKAEVAFGRKHTMYVDALRDVGKVESKAGDWQSASGYVQRAREIAEATPAVGASELIGLEEDQADIEFASGRVLASTGRLAGAALRCDKLFGAKDEKCFTVRARLAGMLLRSGDDQRARAVVPYLMPRLADDSSLKRQVEAAIFISRIESHAGQLPPDHPARIKLESVAAGSVDPQLPGMYQANALLVLAEIAIAEGDLPHATKMVERADAVIADRHVRDPSALAWRSNLQGLLLQAAGQDAAALAKFDAAHAQYALQYGDAHPLTSLYGLHACGSLVRLGRQTQAIALIDSALPKLKAAMGAESPLIERVLRLRARVVGSAQPAVEPAAVAESFM